MRLVMRSSNLPSWWCLCFSSFRSRSSSSWCGRLSRRCNQRRSWNAWWHGGFWPGTPQTFKILQDSRSLTITWPPLTLVLSSQNLRIQKIYAQFCDYRELLKISWISEKFPSTFQKSRKFKRLMLSWSQFLSSMKHLLDFRRKFQKLFGKSV